MAEIKVMKDLFFHFFVVLILHIEKNRCIKNFYNTKTISENPTYLDVGCGYGDFLEKVREYIPKAEGIEKSADIFYSVGRTKPNYITIADAYSGIENNYDIIFVGWMEPGV